MQAGRGALARNSAQSEQYIQKGKFFSKTADILLFIFQYIQLERNFDLITLTFILIFVIRLYSLSISIKNEKELLKAGAKQYGEKNSKILAAAHIAYYFAALAESYIRNASFDSTSAAGLAVLIFSLAMLFCVIKALGAIWTVKIYIHPQHQLNRSWLFKYIKHPNYFLNIIPELIGAALLCHAWTTLIIGFPIYLVILSIRICQEQKAMKHLLTK